MENHALIEKLTRLLYELEDYEGRGLLLESFESRRLRVTLREVITEMHVLLPPEGSGSRTCPFCGKFI